MAWAIHPGHSPSSPGPGAVIPGLHMTVNIRKTVLRRLSPSEYYTDSRLKQTVVFLWRGLSTCPGASAWWTGFMFPSHLEVTKAPPGSVRRKTSSLWMPLSSQWLKDPYQKGAYTLLSSPKFCNCHPGDTSRFSDCGRTVLYIFAYLKAVAWMSGLLSAWNYLLNKTLPLGTLVDLGTPSK